MSKLWAEAAELRLNMWFNLRFSKPGAQSFCLQLDGSLLMMKMMKMNEPQNCQRHWSPINTANKSLPQTSEDELVELHEADWEETTLKPFLSAEDQKWQKITDTEKHGERILTCFFSHTNRDRSEV